MAVVVLGQGHHDGAAHAHGQGPKTFADYMREGPLAALDMIQKITGEKTVAAIGYCIGGTLLGWIVRRVSGRAALNKKGDKYEKLADKTPEKSGDKSE